MERRAVIVAGFGFKADATADSLRDALQSAVRSVSGELDAIATVAGKADAPSLVNVATVLGLPLIAVDRESLQQVRTVTCSTASRSTHGTGSVSEAAALVAAGRGARLIATRQISADRMATCALAEGDGA